MTFDQTRKIRRYSRASFAVIRRDDGCRPRWLAQWNPRWARYNFVGGHLEGDESFRECVIRETAEELDLQIAADFTVGSSPLAHREFSSWSAGADQVTDYSLELFGVSIAPAAMPRVDAQPNNRWLSAEEIAAGQTTDGQPISETVQRLLQDLEELA